MKPETTFHLLNYQLLAWVPEIFLALFCRRHEQRKKYEEEHCCLCCLKTWVTLKTRNRKPRLKVSGTQGSQLLVSPVTVYLAHSSVLFCWFSVTSRNFKKDQSYFGIPALHTMFLAAPGSSGVPGLSTCRKI